MKKGALGVALLFLLVGAVNVQATIQPELVSNLIEYEETLPCEYGRVLLLRTVCYSAAYPSRIDVCDRVSPPSYTAQYTDYCGRLVGSITGVNWPANTPDNATYQVLTFNQAMDSPEGYEPCVDHVKFVGGTETPEFKYKSFTYIVFDMRGALRRQVQSATLRFKASPYYSGAAQNGAFTAHIGVYDMLHSCENGVTDDKRGCFGPLASGTIPFAFPIDPAEFPQEDQIDCPEDPVYQYYRHFSVNVTQSVRDDLGSGGNGYVGFMLASEDIDSIPGMRTVGMTKFILDVELGGTGVPAFSHWGLVAFMLGLVGFTVFVLRRKRVTG